MNFQNVDAIEFLKSLETASVDAVITDPPYGTTALEFDKAIVDWAAWWVEIHRVLKAKGVAVCFSAQPFTTDLIISNRKRFRYDLIWHKNLPVGFPNANVKPLRAHEHILIFSESPIAAGVHQASAPTYNPQKTVGKPYARSAKNRAADHYSAFNRGATVNNGDRHPVSVLQFDNNNHGSLHPTQKPVDLMRWLVRTYSNPGDVVLDPFSGSGSTGVASIIEGRQFFGCELNEEYFRKAKRRLETTPAGLFVEVQ